MQSLAAFRALIIDLDGVLWIGDTPLPGLEEFFDCLRARNLRFILVSNNATTSPESVQSKLARFGAEVPLDAVLTSSEASARFLAERIPAGQPVLVVGEAVLRSAVERAGFRLSQEADEARAVVVGLDREAGWASLSEAALAIRRGALFIATNPDVTFPIERGLALGSGALIAAIQAATAVEPIMVGKPEPHLYIQAMARLHSAAEETLAIGDRLETDILGGRRAGIATALLLSGVTRREDLSRSAIRPDWVFEGLPDLTRALSTSVV
jgi:4-nitrophenyl phosphatase